MAEEKKYKRFFYHITCSWVSKPLEQEMSPEEIKNVIKETFPGLTMTDRIFDTLDYDTEESLSFKSVWTVRGLNETFLELQSLKDEASTALLKVEELENKNQQAALENKQLKSRLDAWEKNFGSINKLDKELKELRTIQELYELQKDEYEAFKKKVGEAKKEKAEQLQDLNKNKKHVEDLIEEKAKLEAELLKLRDIVSELKEHNRVLARSLILSYENYASITSRRLLELLSNLIFETHERELKKSKEELKCETTLKELKDENNHISTSKCLNHFRNCSLNSAEILDNFGNLLSVNFQLNQFVHNLDQGLDEVVLSNQIQNTGLCETTLNQVLTHLKDQFKDDKRIQSLPNEVLRIKQTTSYKHFGCYKIALQEQEQISQ